MKRYLFFQYLLLLLVVSVVAHADDKKKEKEMTIKGEVVEVSCYLRHGAKGEYHQACGVACAKTGSPLGILTEDNTLYVSLLPDNHKQSPNSILMDHIGHMVEAKGIVRSNGGVNGIMINDVSMAKMEEKMEKK